MKRKQLLVSAVALAIATTGACTPADSGGAARPVHNATTAPAELPEDVRLMDDAVRNIHADAFAVVPERVWAKRVEAAAASFPSADQDQRAMLLAGLAGLLDTHTQFFGPPELMYDAWFYRFADGMYVVAARDESLVGARLVSVDGVSATRVEKLVDATTPGDNASADLNAAYLTAYVDHLHGLGIVKDVANPGFSFELAGGARRTVDLDTVPLEAMGTLGVLGSAAGDFTEAVRRRDEALWWRTDRASRSFLVSVNDYVDPTPAIDAMEAALDSGRADRVVIDMRYLRGGDPSPLFSLVQAVSDEKRLGRRGGLTVLIGRENESAATVLAYAFDTGTTATLVGEPTPAMADNFLCPCQDIDLPDTGYVFSVPMSRAGNGDPRPAVFPDRRVPQRAADFFAGRDVALNLALGHRSGSMP